MALKRRDCVNHPDRAAMGVCALTGVPICAECSTRYEGVNYSKEALGRLQAERAAAAAGAASGSEARVWLLGLLVLPQLWLIYKAVAWGAVSLVDLRAAGAGG